MSFMIELVPLDLAKRITVFDQNFYWGKTNVEGLSISANGPAFQHRRDGYSIISLRHETKDEGLREIDKVAVTTVLVDDFCVLVSRCNLATVQLISISSIRTVYRYYWDLLFGVYRGPSKNHEKCLDVANLRFVSLMGDKIKNTNQHAHYVKQPGQNKIAQLPKSVWA